MTCLQIEGGIVCVGSEFKPGDPPPSGYNEWHEWAEVQHEAGLRQKKCAKCGKLKWPQQMSNQTIPVKYSKTEHGQVIIRNEVICNECVE